MVTEECGDLIAPSGIAPSRAAKTGQNEATANQFGRTDIELRFHVPVGYYPIFCASVGKREAKAGRSSRIIC